MDNVAIIDIGSARIKCTIVTFDNSKMTVTRLKEEVSLSANLSPDNVLDETFIKGELANTLARLKNSVADCQCKRLLTLGTHALRQASNADKAIVEIEKYVGKLNIIPAWLEGAVFYAHMQTQIPDKTIAVLDIGGGSVQLSFGTGEKTVYSIPTGTFTLEDSFQKNKNVCTLAELSAMQVFIRDNLKAVGVPKKQCDVLVMGSSCMADFVNAALTVSHGADGIQIKTQGVLKSLLDEIKGQPYDGLQRYYPDNQYFMYGADKALVNLLEVCDFLNIDNILPTNESVATAMIETLAHAPDNLNHYGIAYHLL